MMNNGRTETIVDDGEAVGKVYHMMGSRGNKSVLLSVETYLRLG